MVVAVILDFHKLVDMHVVLDQVGGFFELFEGLAGVVQDEEIEKLLQMLFKISLSVLISRALKDFL